DERPKQVAEVPHKAFSEGGDLCSTPISSTCSKKLDMNANNPNGPRFIGVPTAPRNFANEHAFAPPTKVEHRNSTKDTDVRKQSMEVAALMQQYLGVCVSVPNTGRQAGHMEPKCPPYDAEIVASSSDVTD